MPIGTFINLNNVRPNVQPPSDADLEEARIRRATDLAQLANLQNATPLELRRLALTQAGLDQQTRGQDIQQREGDIQLRGQDLGQEAALRSDVTTRRGQDFEASSRSDANATARRGQDFQTTENQQRIAGALLSEAFANPGADLSKFSAIAKGAGLDNIAAGFAAGHQTEVAHKGAQVVQQLGALPDAASRNTLLQDLSKDPDVYNHVKATAPQYFGDLAGGTNGTAGTVTPPTYDAYGIGQQLGTSLKQFPVNASNIGAKVYNDFIATPADIIGGITGLPKAPRAKYAKSYPINAFQRGQ